MTAAREKPSLRETQQRLWQLIAAPEGVESALRDSPTPALEQVVRSDAVLPAITRLDVYANAYFGRIRQCLEADYATLGEALGEAVFHDLVTSYLAVHPPEHFSLRYAGERLPDFLTAHEAASPFRDRWPFCADLARLEWAMVDVFDAPDSPVAQRGELAKIAPERWAELELALVPACCLIDVGWAVHGLCMANDAGRANKESIAALERRTAVCVWRHAERVFHRELEDVEATALRGIQAGSTFGDLCELAAAAFGEESAAPEAAGWLARWLDDGLLTSARLPST